MRSVTRFVPALMCVAAVLSCNRRPDNVLDDGKMCDVFIDLHKAEAYLENETGGVHNDSLHKVYMQSVFRQQGITRAQFDTTLVWYGHHVDKFDAVYDKVISRLSEELGRPADGLTGGKEGKEVWSGFRRILLTPRNACDQISFAIDSTQIHAGDKLIWEFKPLTSGEGPVTFVGVDYTDGTTAYVSSSHMGMEPVAITFQIDSLLKPVRAYGYARSRGGVTSPVLFDSISLRVCDFTPETYYEVYNQRHFKSRR